MAENQLITMLKLHSGRPAEVYILGSDEPWELICIERVWFDEDGFYFLEGRLDANKSPIVIHVTHITSIIFHEPKDKKPTKVTNLKDYLQ